MKSSKSNKANRKTTKQKKLTLNDLGQNELNAYEWIVKSIFEDHQIGEDEVLKYLNEYKKQNPDKKISNILN
ncbi:hypothetical protein [Mycoplasma nasistruthionis]|uniref:Uncharacterized protein n=1 Tax=Mycoplasma nasistruthionis TaxID=353852 RepID=A0A4Y6I8G1_9MOLU|nr:hypothetical protein [Mycoplasma nasistruthionis]QCZ36921.1 hypothetical protein FG904_02820 [Mycoplasma nasistruthionis]QDF65198.1 hypothetical protein FIV53_02790 [Mycoplasma nasistruthionis]